MTINHCGMCGTTHEEGYDNCPDDAFNYFICNGCKVLQRMPYDCSVQGIHCGCGEDASEAWEGITSEDYKDGVAKEKELLGD